MGPSKAICFIALGFCLAVSPAIAGILLNQHVEAINGGSMPVVATGPEAIGFVATVQRERRHGNTIHTIATSATRWAWAADRIPVADRDPRFIDLYSIGDVMMTCGAMLLALFTVIVSLATLFVFLTRPEDPIALL